MAEGKKKIEKVNLGTEFSNCPKCGYDRGFHNMFRKAADNGHLDWYLICPNCGKAFDIGLTFISQKKRG